MSVERVSVIVPVFNNEKYLRDCVESICRQSFIDLEIILVDDGSTDLSGGICDEMTETDCRIKVVHTANRGVSAARNLGVELASGTHIIFVDSDDALHPMMVRTLVDLLSEFHAECAVCAFTALTDRLTDKGAVSTYSSRRAIELTLYQTAFDSSLCCKLIPAYAMKKVRLREGLRYEDLDSIYHIYENISGDIVATSAPMYYYRDNPGSFTHNFTDDRLDVLTVTDNIVAHYREDREMSLAARDRRFAANFNMFVLSICNGRKSVADRCWRVIRKSRWEELFNPKVRLKNKAGAIVSCLGKSLTAFLVRHFFFRK